MLDNTERPTIEERYDCATSASDLTIDEHKRGPIYLMIAGGLAARDGMEQRGSRPNISLGHSLAILRSEWHKSEKPIVRHAKSLKRWIEELPLVKVGERTIHGRVVPIMGRDKEGAKKAQRAEREAIAQRYHQELVQLAQKLPTRAKVRESLYTLALWWGWEEADDKVSAVLCYWLDDNCTRCHGTKEITVHDKPQACPDCKGTGKSRVPHGDEGYAMFQHMNDCTSLWRGSVKKYSNQLRGVMMQFDRASVTESAAK